MLIGEMLYLHQTRSSSGTASRYEGPEANTIYRCHPPLAEIDKALKALHADLAVSLSSEIELEELLAVHLGEAPKLCPPGRAAGVANSDVVGGEKACQIRVLRIARTTVIES